VAIDVTSLDVNAPPTPGFDGLLVDASVVVVPLCRSLFSGLPVVKRDSFDNGTSF